MARFLFKYTPENKELYAVCNNQIINGKKMEILIDIVSSADILNVKIIDNRIILTYGEDEIIIEDPKLFLQDPKYMNLKNKIMEYVQMVRQRTIAKSQNKSPKKSKSLSTKNKIKSILLTSLVLGAGLSIKSIINNFNAEPTEPYIEEQYEEDANIIPDDTVLEILKTTYTREEYLNRIKELIEESEIDPNLILPIAEKDTEFTEEKINEYKNLIEHLKFLIADGYDIELVISDNKSAYLGVKNGGFVVTPASYNKINAIVQMIPGCTDAANNLSNTSTNAFSFYLNDVRNGKLPDYLVIGSATMFKDLDYKVNGNMLERCTDFAISHGLNIQNIGVMDFSWSGETGMINAGRLSAKHPDINVKVANVDAYYIDAYINNLDSFLNGNKNIYSEPINALIQNGSEIVNIIPYIANYSNIPSNRPRNALNQSIYLAQNGHNSHIITSTCNNHSDYPKEAYEAGVLDYLAGKIDIITLAKSGENYFIPNIMYNDATRSWEYKNSEDLTYVSTNKVDNNTHYHI